MFCCPDEYRIREGTFGSSRERDGNNGVFAIEILKGPDPKKGRMGRRVKVYAIAGDGFGWEHVSVSLPGRQRCPTWDEMEFVCRLFWGEDDAVMQLHPPRSQWISNHPFVLHLWRPKDGGIPTPPSILVGVRGNEA